MADLPVKEELRNGTDPVELLKTSSGNELWVIALLLINMDKNLKVLTNNVKELCDVMRERQPIG